MDKKGLSPVGYGIVAILIIAFVMIISTPLIIEQNKDHTVSQNEKKHIEDVADSQNYSSDRISELEDRLNNRISNIENKIQNYSTDKYICSIEGGLNEDGIVVPIDPSNPPAKFVFSCEYRK